MSEGPNTELYAALNIPLSASRSDIQKAFKKLSRVLHPDKLRSFDENSDDAFKAVRQAHDILVDPTLRLAYDHAGMQAVNLLLRSHFAKKGPESKEDVSINDDDDDDDDEGESMDEDDDLYAQVRDAASHFDAVRILDDALEEAKAHFEESRRPRTDVAATILQYAGESVDSLLDRDSSSLHLQTKRKLSQKVECTVAATSSVKRTGKIENATQLTWDYHHPGYGPLGSAIVTVSPNMEAPIVKVQTSRLLSTGTNVLVNFGGSLSSFESWSYSFISNRRVLFGQEANADQNGQVRPLLVASWHLAVSSLGQFQFFRFEISRPKLPKWQLGFGLDAISASFETAKLAFSVVQSWTWYRYKATCGHTWRDWTLRYGIAFDGRQQMMGNNAWKVLFQLASDTWDVRLPVSISPWLQGDVISRVAAVLIADLFDSQLDIWHNQRQKKLQKVAQRRPTEGSTSFTSPPRMKEAVTLVAQKKRAFEESHNGLIIIAATLLQGFSSKVDVTDALQFWINKGRLNLPLHELQWWQGSPVEKSQTRSWSWNWHQLVGGEPPQSGHHENAGALEIRYRYANVVYEIRFEGDELIWLPNERAVVLGNAGTVR